MIKAYKEYWQGYVDFRGRTSVGGFWWALLANFIVTFALSLFSALLAGRRAGTAGTTVTLMTFMYLCLLPSLAIMIRRLRDGGNSWANIFWAFLPIVGSIILIVKLCKPTSDGGTYKPIAQQRGASGAPVYQTYAAPTVQPAPAAQPATPVAQPAAAPPPPSPAPAPVQPTVSPAPSAGGSILDQYRAGLAYLDGCGAFDEAKFREFNRVTGGRFSEGDIQGQLANARRMMGGMEDLRKVLRSTMLESIQTFEQLQRSGIDLSKYKL